MEKIEKGTKVKVMGTPAGLERYIGTPAIAAEHMGKSGDTQLFDLASGGGLFLKADQVVPVA